MNNKKIEKLQLKASIDTLSFKSTDRSLLYPSYLNKIELLKGSEKYLYRINPNNTIRGELSTCSEFQETMAYILEDLGLSNYETVRIDFRIDCTEDNFDELLKLNKCIILLLSEKYDVKNRYQSFDPKTLKNLSICIKKRQFEAENYNKKLQEMSGNIYNRLELRSKEVKNQSIETLIVEWLKKLVNSLECFEELQDFSNQVLLNKWKEELETGYIPYSQFILNYRENIFTRKQLINLCKLMGSKNPENLATSVKKRNNKKLEYFTMTDLKNYIEILKTALNDFLNT